MLKAAGPQPQTILVVLPQSTAAVSCGSKGKVAKADMRQLTFSGLKWVS